MAISGKNLDEETRSRILRMLSEKDSAGEWRFSYRAIAEASGVNSITIGNFVRSRLVELTRAPP